MMGGMGLAIRAKPKQPEGGDALDLLTVLGDSKRTKEAKAYLTELREVLAANEAVVTDANRLITEAKERTEAAIKAEAEAPRFRRLLPRSLSAMGE